MLNLSGLMGRPVSVAEPTRWLRGGETLTLGATTWDVLHTPGHSPGSVCYIHRASGRALVGDTIFAGSVGRTDFPSSDHEVFQNSLRRMLEELPDDMRIWPGHGPATDLATERAGNPFLRALP